MIGLTPKSGSVNDEIGLSVNIFFWFKSQVLGAKFFISLYMSAKCK